MFNSLFPTAMKKDSNTLNFKHKRRKTKAINPQKTIGIQNSFINLTALGNCTACKLSIVALILFSFLVVNPQKTIPPDNSMPNDTTQIHEKDTIHYGGYIKDTLLKSQTH